MVLPWQHFNRSLTVGIDIDVNTIKLVALRRKRPIDPIFELVSYAYRVTTPEFPLIHEALRNVLQQVGINKKSKIVIALPYGQVLIKTIRFNTANDLVELENNIIEHCEKMIAYPIHEACLDFEVVKDCDVRIVIARRGVVEEKINLFSTSEFTIAAVDVESDALARCVHYVLSQEKAAFENQMTIVMHIASQKILGLILYGKLILFAQEIVMSITDPGGIRAEDYLEKVKILFPILELVANNFLTEEYKSAYLSEKIYVSGCQFISNNFRLQVNKITRKQSCLVNPFLNMERKEGISMRDINQYAQDLVVGCGLAMRDFRHGY